MDFGWLKKLNPVDRVGAALTAGSDAQAQQRASREEMEMDRERLRQNGEQSYIEALFAREQARQSGSANAWKQLLQADHISQGGTKTPGVSTYSKPRQGPSAELQRMASQPDFLRELEMRAHYADPLNPTNAAHSDMQLRRLAIPGSEYAPDVYGQMDRHTRPGKGETVSGWLGALLRGGGGSYGAQNER